MNENHPVIPGYIHIQVKEVWFEYKFTSPDGKKWNIPPRFLAKDKNNNVIIIVTVPYNTGTLGHGMGSVDTIKFTATWLNPENGLVVNVDERIKREGFYVRDNTGCLEA